MEIERINENTVKFYISYIDIEDRGFEREEIWYNRERSEQLFWQMMDEVNYKEDFTVEGPLWIQVQALEKGLEIVVTKAKVSKNGEKLEPPKGDSDTIDITVNEKIEGILEDKFGESTEEDEEAAVGDDITLWIIVSINDFEDVIQLSHYFPEKTEDVIEETLYHYNDKYYLYMEFAQDITDHQENLISQVFEFGKDSDVTIHLLEEYGNKIFEENTFSQVRKHFPAQL